MGTLVKWPRGSKFSKIYNHKYIWFLQKSSSRNDFDIFLYREGTEISLYWMYVCSKSWIQLVSLIEIKARLCGQAFNSKKSKNWQWLFTTEFISSQESKFMSFSDSLSTLQALRKLKTDHPMLVQIYSMLSKMM